MVSATLAPLRDDALETAAVPAAPQDVPLPLVPSSYAVIAFSEPERVPPQPLPTVAAVLPPAFLTAHLPDAAAPPVCPVEKSPATVPVPVAVPRPAPVADRSVPSWPGLMSSQTRPLVRQGPQPPADLRASSGPFGGSGSFAVSGGGAAVLDDARPRRSFVDYLRPALRVLAYVAGAWLALTLALMVIYRFVNPPVSSLMLQQWLAGTEIKQNWLPLDRISPHVVRAVLVSEDGRFCQHWGVDLDAMQDALEHVGEGNARGASTISMQVVKNLFLWPSKSYVRKAVELPLTWLMELLWPKRRIMEVYLNIAEWGPGIFGVEAASRFHFNRGASRLNERQAAQLAVALPNPHLRDAGDPGPMTRRLARDIQTRMRNAYRGQTACVLNVHR